MIDLEHLERQTAGDTALQQDLLGLFLMQIDDMCRMIDGNDLIKPMALAAVVHRLRGAAMAVGAFSLASTLSQAETSLETDPNTDVGSTLRPALRHASSEVSRLLPR